MADKLYRMPDGSHTKLLDVYGNAWRELGEAIGKITGSKLYGYDPDLAFTEDFQFSWSIPAHIAIRIVEAIKEKSHERISSH